MFVLFSMMYYWNGTTGSSSQSWLLTLILFLKPSQKPTIMPWLHLRDTWIYGYTRRDRSPEINENISWERTTGKYLEFHVFALTQLTISELIPPFSSVMEQMIKTRDNCATSIRSKKRWLRRKGVTTRSLDSTMEKRKINAWSAILTFSLNF